MHKIALYKPSTHVKGVLHQEASSDIPVQKPHLEIALIRRLQVFQVGEFCDSFYVLLWHLRGLGVSQDGQMG